MLQCGFGKTKGSKDPHWPCVVVEDTEGKDAFWVRKGAEAIHQLGLHSCQGVPENAQRCYYLGTDQFGWAVVTQDEKHRRVLDGSLKTKSARDIRSRCKNSTITDALTLYNAVVAEFKKPVRNWDAVFSSSERPEPRKKTAQSATTPTAPVQQQPKDMPSERAVFDIELVNTAKLRVGQQQFVLKVTSQAFAATLVEVVNLENLVSKVRSCVNGYTSDPQAKKAAKQQIQVELTKKNFAKLLKHHGRRNFEDLWTNCICSH